MGTRTQKCPKPGRNLAERLINREKFSQTFYVPAIAAAPAVPYSGRRAFRYETLRVPSDHNCCAGVGSTAPISSRWHRKRRIVRAESTKLGGFVDFGFWD